MYVLIYCLFFAYVKPKVKLFLNMEKLELCTTETDSVSVFSRYSMNAYFHGFDSFGISFRRNWKYLLGSVLAEMKNSCFGWFRVDSAMAKIKKALQLYTLLEYGGSRYIFYVDISTYLSTVSMLITCIALTADV